MKLFQVGAIIVCAVFVWGVNIGFGQAPETAENHGVRVTVSISTDGSRTVYKFDDAQHKAVATITDQDGKLRQTIRYELDDAGRFTSGQIFGPDGRLRFNSQYNYDSVGRLQEETQSAEDGSLLHKIVYSYDQNGKRTGYSIFDASGKLLGRTTPLITGQSASPKSREKTPR